MNSHSFTFAAPEFSGCQFCCITPGCGAAAVGGLASHYRENQAHFLSSVPEWQRKGVNNKTLSHLDNSR